MTKYKSFSNFIHISVVLSLSLLFIKSQVFAAETPYQSLTFPEAYEVLKVDGDDYSANFFETETILELSSGEHTILVVYEGIFDDFANDDHTKVTSEPFLLSITIANEPLRIRSPKLADEKVAKEYIKKPELIIVNKNEQTQPHQLVFLKDVANQMLTMQKTTITNGVVNSKATNAETTKNSQPLDMLHYWWLKATPEEQRLFNQMINHSSEN